MAYLHNLRTPFLHGDFKPSDVLVPAKDLQPKITNFGLCDFKNFFVENAQREYDYMEFLNACQAPEVLVGGKFVYFTFLNSYILPLKHTLPFLLANKLRISSFESIDSGKSIA